MRRILLTGLMLVLASCSSAPTPAPAPPPPITTPTVPATAIPTSPPPTATPTAASEKPKDQCGLAEAQGYVGLNRTALPAPVDPSRRRVACTTCPVTMDFRPDRLNILFNADTGVVQEVKCG